MNSTPEEDRSQKVLAWSVLGCGLLIWLILTAISLLGYSYRYETPSHERPIVLVTSLFISASLIALVSLWLGLKIKSPSRDFLIYVFLFSLAFRLVQLSAPPFQEIDCYRYLWDGTVVANGYSPYRHSPEQILNATSDEPDVNALRRIALRDEGTFEVISRIHFGHIRTLYPPVSQAVFAATVYFVPEGAGVETYLTAIKSAITLFDLGTLGLLTLLLRLLRFNPLWSMAYGWNLLVVKEFSNSGHLDSIAVFFATGTFTALVLFIQKAGNDKENSGGWIYLIAGSISLASGFAAKIYPIILLPLCLVFVLRNSGWLRCLAFGLFFSIASVVLFWPMVSAMQNQAEQKADSVSETDGLSTFLRHWQINEWAYMLVYQNLREIDPGKKIDRPWFRVLGDGARQLLLRPVKQFVGDEDAAYYLSRLITLGIFGIFYLSLLYYVWTKYSADPSWLLTGAFWIITVFFCLQPTQNPWYWTWALPLIPFSRANGWLIYSTFLFIYYLRFAFSSVGENLEFLGFRYSGQGYFDYVIVWVEHLPVFLLVSWQLCNQYFASRKKKSENITSNTGNS